MQSHSIEYNLEGSQKANSLNQEIVEHINIEFKWSIFIQRLQDDLNYAMKITDCIWLVEFLQPVRHPYYHPSFLFPSSTFFYNLILQCKSICIQAYPYQIIICIIFLVERCGYPCNGHGRSEPGGAQHNTIQKNRDNQDILLRQVCVQKDTISNTHLEEIFLKLDQSFNKMSCWHESCRQRLSQCPKIWIKPPFPLFLSKAILLLSWPESCFSRNLC